MLLYVFSKELREAIRRERTCSASVHYYIILNFLKGPILVYCIPHFLNLLIVILILLFSSPVRLLLTRISGLGLLCLCFMAEWTSWRKRRHFREEEIEEANYFVLSLGSSWSTPNGPTVLYLHVIKHLKQKCMKNFCIHLINNILYITRTS